MSPCPRLAGSGATPNGSTGLWTHKKRVRKAPSVPDGSSSKLFAPSTSARILSDGRPKKISPPVQHHTIKIKTAGGHTAVPAKTYKPWDRPASRSLRHNVCNAAICRSQVNDLAPIFTGNAQRINYILYIPQYIVSVNIIVLLFCVFRVSVMKLSSGGKQSKRIVCVLLAY